MDISKVLIDTSGKKWMMAEMIGSGGFSKVYDARSEDDREVIIKLEDSCESDCLVTEIRFYRYVATKYNIETWITGKGIPHLGIPGHYGYGVVYSGPNKFRFLVLEKLGTDIQTLLAVRKILPTRNIKKIAAAVLSVLEFIHYYGYCHGDVKSENVMLDRHDKVYLIDYGLLCLYLIGGVHRKYVEIPANKCNGTLPYASIDSHKGAHVSRRGDLESLGYCMIKWYTGKLPWETLGADYSAVYLAKLNVLKMIRDEVERYVDRGIGAIYRYMNTVTSLSYDEKPDYSVLKTIIDKI